MSETLDQEPNDGYQTISWGPRDEHIPLEWDLKCISDISENVIYPQRDKPKNLEGEIPWIRIEDLDGKYVSESDSGKGVTEETIQEMNLSVFPSGTLMCSCSGNMGICAITERELISNQTFAGIVPSENIHTEYLYYTLENLKDDLQRMSTGTTIPYLSSDKLKEFTIPYPPISEQCRIADILSTVDKQIQQTDKIIEEAKELKKGLRRDLVIGGISHSEYQPFRVGPFEFNIPGSWGVASVEEVAENLDSQRVPVKKKKREEMNGEVPYYGASGQIDTVDDWLFDEELLLLAEDGENLLSRNKPIAFKVSGKTWINNHAHVLKPHSDMSLEYLLNYFEILSFEPYATGTAQPKLNQKVLNLLEVPKPPKAEQDKISDILIKATDIIDQERSNRKKLQELKRGLMQDLLTGKVRVNTN